MRAARTCRATPVTARCCRGSSTSTTSSTGSTGTDASSLKDRCRKKRLRSGPLRSGKVRCKKSEVKGLQTSDFRLAKATRECLRQVHCASARGLLDLFATTEAIGDDDRFGRSAADGGEERELSDLQRQLVVLLFESKAPCHPAAP